MTKSYNADIDPRADGSCAHHGTYNFNWIFTDDCPAADGSDAIHSMATAGLVECWHGYRDGSGYWEACSNLSPRVRHEPAPPPHKAFARMPPPPVALPAKKPVLLIPPVAAPLNPPPPGIYLPEHTAPKTSSPDAIAQTVAPSSSSPAFSLNHEWPPYAGPTFYLAAAVMFAVAFRPLVTRQAIFMHKAHEKISKATADYKTAAAKRKQQVQTAKAERKKQAEKRRLAAMTPAATAEAIRRTNAEIDRLCDEAERLSDMADYCEASRFHIPFVTPGYVALLRYGKENYSKKGLALCDALARAEELSAEITQDQAKEVRASVLQQTRTLFTRILSKNDASAAAALVRLNGCHGIDWLADVIPRELPAAARAQAAKFAALAAGTTNLGEARAAVQKLFNLMEQHAVEPDFAPMSEAAE